MTPVDLLNSLNDPDRNMEFGEVDKSQVYRWLKGQMPNPGMQLRLAAVLGFEGEPERILQHPTIDWLSEFFRERTEAETEKAIQMLKLMFPGTKTGTDN